MSAPIIAMDLMCNTFFNDPKWVRFLPKDTTTHTYGVRFELPALRFLDSLFYPTEHSRPI